MRVSLRELCRRGELQAVRRWLAEDVAIFDAGGGKLSEHERLTIEAEYYARIGDLDEAEFRLRLRDEPKWHSVESCEVAYHSALRQMAA